MSPVLRMLVGMLFGGIAVWFRRNRFDRGEPARWFFAFLCVATLTMVLSAVSWWIPDETISRSFWTAYLCGLSIAAFCIFGFARSFGSKFDYTLLFWSLPLMLDVAIILLDNRYILRRSGDTWVSQNDNIFFIIHIAIAAFYALASIYYCFMVYFALRSHEQVEEAAHFRYILAGLLVIFASFFLVGLLRSILNPGNPVTEICTLLGTILLLIGIVEPKIAFLEKKRQGVA